MTAIVIAVFVTATAATFLLMPPTIWSLRRVAVVAAQTNRSSHNGTVVSGGGIAVVAGSALGLALMAGQWSLEASVGAALLFGVASAAVGFVDDTISLPALLRLGTQALFAGAFVLALPNQWLIGSIFVAVPLAALWLVAVTNGFNFMDGINGITGVSGCILGISLAIASLRWKAGVEIPSAALAGASLGFLPFNAPRARIFLGDVGSYAIGAGLAALTVVAYQNGVPLATLTFPFALYLTDTGLTLFRRALRGESILQAHREHSYQRLVHDRGWSHMRVTSLVAVIISMTAMLGHVAPRSSGMLALSLAGVVSLLAFYILTSDKT